MKRLAILSAIALSGLIYNTADAQIRIHLGLHFGPRPVIYTQAPVVVQQPVYEQTEQVYDDSNDDDYYYLPDVNAYYNVNARSYYYYNGYNWITCAYLPGAYRNYDWRSARRYEIHEHRPFMRSDFYRSRYNGHDVAEWRHYNNNNHFNNGYARNDHFNRDAYYRNDNHYDNRAQGGYDRHDQNRDNRGQGGYSQPNQNNGGYNNGWRNSSRPSTQNNGGQNRDNRRGDEHFASNAMGMSHRPARF